MDKKDNILTKEILIERNKLIKTIDKITKLIPRAKTKKKKEIVNNYIDLAQKHYDNMYNLLNKYVNKINESNENIYNEIKSNTDPNAELLPLKKLEMFKQNEKFIKLIIEE
jgi:Mg2+ and Co2+ transporter CorA